VFTVALGLSTNLWVFYAFMFLFGLFVPLFSTPFMTLFQETVDPEKQGRVFSYVGIVMALATPIGMTVFGPLADVVEVETLLIIAGLLTIVVFLVALLVPSGRAAMAAARQADEANALAKPEGQAAAEAT
jgi:DHA3 family macrolide efflux protein-like MFS transporter